MGATRNWLFLLLTVGSCVDAAMFCAHDGGQLQAAMSVAANNNQDDDVRITTGTKTFAVPIGFPHLFGYQIETTAEEDNDLVVSGGWNSNCSTMSPGAQHTVLDGQNQEADILVVSRHSAYFVDPKGSYTIRNLTVANAGGGENAIRSLISTTSNTAELVLDHVQVRGGTSTVYLYGGRIDVSHLLATGVTGGSDIVELAPSRAGSRIVYSSVYDNLLGPFSNDYCPLRLTGVKVIANNVAFGHQTTDGDVVRDACLYADNIEGSPQTDNNHFRAANINFLYTVDMHNQSYGVPDVETVTAGGYLVKQPRFGALQDSGIVLSPNPTHDIFGRPRLVNVLPDRGAIESDYCRMPTMPAIQDLTIDERASGGGLHPVGTEVGIAGGNFWFATGFSISAGNGVGNVFSITSSGLLRVANPAELGQQSTYYLTVNATDLCGSTSGTVRVTVTADAMFASSFE